jgi:hypothetical protein
MSKRLVIAVSLCFILGVVLAACAGMGTKPTASNFKTPKITLAYFEVPQYDGYWYYAASVKPTKGDAGDHGAPLPMSFVIDVENPNPYPVLLEGITYTVAFDKDFALYTGNNGDSYWIPAGKTDQVRLSTMITARSALLSLLVTAGYTLKDRGWSPWDALDRWWTGVPTLSVPVTLKECSFTFKADGLVKAVPFEATFP